MFRYNYYSLGVRLLNLLAGNQLLFQSKTAILQTVVMHVMHDARVQLTPLVQRGRRGPRPPTPLKEKPMTVTSGRSHIYQIVTAALR